MDSFKNISIKLRATGLVAALIVWVGAVAVVGVFGEGTLVSYERSRDES